MNKYQPYQREGNYYNAQGGEICRTAYYAIRAAILRPKGKWIARQHFLKQSGKKELALYRLACQLLAAAKAEE